MTTDITVADDLLAPNVDLQLIHTRDYQVHAFRTPDNNMVIRGAVRDTKPPFLYWPTDPDSLVIHHMAVELDVTFGSMVITAARVLFSEYPHVECPGITTRYQQLVGISIARGYSHKVRELFGGPRGCSHTTALLQAMGPIAMQSLWSMRSARMNDGSFEERTDVIQNTGASLMSNTCHVWEDGGEVSTMAANGVDIGVPLPMVRRLTALGIDPIEFRRRQST